MASAGGGGRSNGDKPKESTTDTAVETRTRRPASEISPMRTATPRNKPTNYAPGGPSAGRTATPKPGKNPKPRK